MLELAAVQVAAGDSVLLISASADRSGMRAIRDLDVWDVRCRAERPWRDLEFLVRSRGVTRAFRPDIVHVHNNWAGAALLTGVPAPKVLSFDFFEYRGSSNAALKSTYRNALRMFDLLLPVSDYCRGEAIRWWSLPSQRFRVVPNGVNTDMFRPDADRRRAARAKYGVDDHLVIGYVGRVCRQKGSDVLIDAFRRVRQAHPAATLLVAGPSGQFGTQGGSDLTEAIAVAGGRWLGAVPDEELSDVFRSLDIFVMPTREHEMFGMAAAEALSCGTLVVCSDLGGLPEVVPSSAGVLVPPDDVAALAEALIALFGDPRGLGLRAEAARGAAAKYAWPRVAQAAEDAYRLAMSTA
jgi:glycosyltransferase involved in cell wall biosynthesis